MTNEFPANFSQSALLEESGLDLMRPQRFRLFRQFQHLRQFELDTEQNFVDQIKTLDDETFVNKMGTGWREQVVDCEFEGRLDEVNVR